MHKKWLWLLVLPVLLCGAVFWAQKARLSRIENEFRLLLIQEYATSQAKGIEVFIGDGKREQSLGFLRRAEVQAIAKEMFLRKSVPTAARTLKTLQLRFEGESIDLAIALDGDWKLGGDKDFLPGWRKGWEAWELTPASRRALRQRVGERWDQKIARFRRESAKSHL